MKNIIANIKALKTKDVVVALLILVLPFLTNMWILFPEAEVWETKWFNIESQGFADIQVFFWLLFYESFVVFSLFIWFFTCKNWWRNAILIPLIIEFYKLYNLIFNSSTVKKIDDQSEIIESLLIIIPIIIITMFLIFRVNYYLQLMRIKWQISQEIELLFNDEEFVKNSEIKKIESFLFELKKNKRNYTKEEYTILLFKLRNSVFNLN
ncbi:hypothetical protein Q4512_07545 [Oceanihabitans sp. 2_MG-2023]|uniref:hypothetical protein n=1 Tax=Oceanihabitans sp. 2_MG-2023 TaxID=3062661 RepID=UPI0026E24F4A|nr:hypothetical protein [Oceanihabitans sp. 2_MG-2023]MDO6596765.1 hypothetical protein [Oceanihabitans sp. 2_MG-2023]